MSVSLDDIVAVLQATIWRPSLHAALLAWALFEKYGRYKGRFSSRSSAADVALVASLVVLVCHLISFASREHRNGWTRTRRLSPIEWREQVVVVTGGSGGVGSELCDFLVKKGARVAVWDVVRVATPEDGRAFYQCDVSDPASVKATAARVQEEVGPVTMLVNNAGVLNGKLLTDLEDAEIQRILGVNLASHLYTVKAFLPGMVQRGCGHIVTVSSVMGHIGIAQVGDYVATKHALVGLHESLRYELDKKHKAPKVRTTLVCPGHIKTALFAHVQIPKLAEFLAPLLEPGDVARAIVDALERQESSDIYLPWYAQWTPMLRILPSFLRDFAQHISGADEAIEEMYRRRAVLSDQAAIGSNKDER